MSLFVSSPVLMPKLRFIIFSMGLLLTALPARAQVDLGLDFASGIGLPDADIRTIVTSLTRSLLGLLGILLAGQTIYGGFLMMTHGGNEEKRAEAAGVIKHGVVGFAVIMMSSSIAAFVVNAVVGAASGIS